MLLRLGIPQPALQSMIETIQEMDHYIRMAFGVSDVSYGFDHSCLASQGILQGNGAGPARWFVIGSVLLLLMHAAGSGYHEWTVIRKRALHIVSFTFVDDMDLVHANNSPDTSMANLIDKAQVMVLRWHGLLRATGSDLALEKAIGTWWNSIGKMGDGNIKQ